MRNRISLILIALLALLVVSVSGVFANQVAAGQVGGDSVVVAAPKTQQVLDLYDPDASQANWFNEYNLVVYSRTSKNGEQTDIVRRGHFFDELFIGSDGKIHVRRCGNKVFQIGVEKTIVCPAGPAGKNGYDGKDGRDGANGAEGAPGAEGLQGPKGDKGDVGTGITNNYFTSVPVMCGQIGGQSPYMSNSMQLMSLTMYPMADTNISVSATATGGNAPTNIDVINNNANTNVNTNPNNNVINIGPGSADGSVTGTGTGSSTAGGP